MSSKKLGRKAVGLLLIVATVPLNTASSLELTTAILLTTVGLILIFFG